MMMPGRKYDAGVGYRYGFNGKENDNEVKGEGNQQDYGMRIYDLRLGRFLSIDPITKKYPELTPYQFASNSPIRGIDQDGLELYLKNDALVSMSLSYDPKLKKITDVSTFISLDNGNLAVIRAGMETLIAQNKASCQNCVCVTSNNTINVYQLGINPNFEDKSDDKDALNDVLDLPKNVSGEENFEARTFSGKATASNNEMQKAESDAFTSSALGVNSSRLDKANAGLAVITFAGKMLMNWGQDNLVNGILKQSAKGAPQVAHMLQEAIDNKLPGVTIPNEFLNDGSLIDFANYLLNGQIIKGDDGKENKTAMNIARSIWESYRQREAEKNFKEKMLKPKTEAVDQTNRKNF
jgi:RHS repeat-associated protein